jgi:hypothetical protein
VVHLNNQHCQSRDQKFLDKRRINNVSKALTSRL